MARAFVGQQIAYFPVEILCPSVPYEIFRVFQDKELNIKNFEEVDFRCLAPDKTHLNPAFNWSYGNIPFNTEILGIRQQLPPDAADLIYYPGWIASQGKCVNVLEGLQRKRTKLGIPAEAAYALVFRPKCAGNIS